MKRGRTSWLVKLSPALRQAVYLAIEARDRSAREIYSQHNLRRFTAFSTFRHTFAQHRRDRQARHQGSIGRGTTKPVTLADLERAVLSRLVELINSGSTHGSHFHELRLLLSDVRKYRGLSGRRAGSKRRGAAVRARTSEAKPKRGRA